MKKLFLSAAILLGMFAVSATTDNKPPATAECLQCGVSNATIKEYLQNCSHHHTVYSVSDIPGTCNSLAQIENTNTATVYVSSGIIVGHSDGSGGAP